MGYLGLVARLHLLSMCSGLPKSQPDQPGHADPPDGMPQAATIQHVPGSSQTCSPHGGPDTGHVHFGACAAPVLSLQNEG